jgi:sec-independent protein translocase protein TatC
MSEETGDSFLSHLVELRDRLIRALIAIGVVFLCLFPWAKELYSLLAQPLLDKLPQGGQMIATDVIGVFLVPMKVALMVAFLIALPYVLYQIWAFIAPGLYAHEKKLALPLVGVSVFLFFVGMAFAYFLVFPTVFGFMAKVAPEGVAWMTDIEKYLSFVMTTFMAFGVTFEVPVLVVVLVYANIVDLAKLKEWRPYVIVGSFVVAAVLTPPDVISQLLMAIPMCLLFELGLALARFVTKRSARQERPYDEEPAAAAEGEWKALSADEMNKAVADLDTPSRTRPEAGRLNIAPAAARRRCAAKPSGRGFQEGAFSAFSTFSGPATVSRCRTGAPSSNSHRLPLGSVVHCSLSVSGTVAITATRSSGVVTALKSMLTSWSRRWATANGAWRMM